MGPGGAEQGTVLIVDTDELFQRALARAARAASLTAISLFDGSRTAAVAVECQPDVIVLNISIPRANPLAILRVLKHDLRTQRIPVFVHAGPTKSGRISFLQLQADAHLARPLDVQQLVAKIRAQIAAARSVTEHPVAPIALPTRIDDLPGAVDESEMFHYDDAPRALWRRIDAGEIDRWQAAALQADRMERPRTRRPAAEKSSHPNRPILIVEDDPAIRQSIQSILEDEGYTTSVASNGREALDLLNNDALPWMILLDLMMPVMSGWEFRKQLSRASRTLPPIPLVVMSARAPDPEDKDSLAWLQKPLHLETLLDILDEANDTRQVG